MKKTNFLNKKQKQQNRKKKSINLITLKLKNSAQQKDNRMSTERYRWEKRKILRFHCICNVLLLTYLKYYNGNMENQVTLILVIEFFSVLDIILTFKNLKNLKHPLFKNESEISSKVQIFKVALALS